MDTVMRGLLADCGRLADPALVEALVPGFSASLPPWVEVPGAGPRIPFPAAAEVVAALGAVLPGLLEAARSAEGAERPGEAGEDDPLVAALLGLYLRADAPGLRSAAAIPLALAWAASRALHGRAEELARIDAEAAEALAGCSLSDLDPAEAGGVVERLGWALAARAATAAALARRRGGRADPGGLGDALLRSRLVLGLPPEPGAADPARAAALLGLPFPEGVLAGIEALAGAVVRASRGRVAAGKAQAVDEALLALGLDADTPEEAAAAAILWHPWRGPWLLSALPALVSAKEVEAAGLPGARRLLRGDACRALAASWRELVVEVLRWELFAALLGRFEPLRLRAGQPARAAGGLLDGERWAWLAPGYRPRPPVGTVVALGLDRVAAALHDLPEAPAAVRAAVRRAWREAAAELGLELVGEVGDAGVCLVRDPLRAAELALDLSARLSGPGTLRLDGREVTVPAACRVPAGIETGPVHGGTDGAGAPDPLGVRRASPGSVGLASDGVVAGPGFVEAWREAVDAGGRVAHPRGSDRPAGGVSRDFRAYPVEGWWERGESVVALVGLSGPAGHEGAVELVALERAAFADFARGDAELARSEPAASAAGSVGDADPFGFGDAAGLPPAIPADDADPFGFGPPATSGGGGEVTGLDALSGLVVPEEEEEPPATPGGGAEVTGLDALSSLVEPEEEGPAEVGGAGSGEVTGLDALSGLVEPDGGGAPEGDGGVTGLEALSGLLESGEAGPPAGTEGAALPDATPPAAEVEAAADAPTAPAAAVEPGPEDAETEVVVPPTAPFSGDGPEVELDDDWDDEEGWDEEEDEAWEDGDARTEESAAPEDADPWSAEASPAFEAAPAEDADPWSAEAAPAEAPAAPEDADPWSAEASPAEEPGAFVVPPDLREEPPPEATPVADPFGADLGFATLSEDELDAPAESPPAGASPDDAPSDDAPSEEAAPAASPAGAGGEDPARAAVIDEIVRLLSGYVVVSDGQGGYLFGLLRSGLLVDVTEVRAADPAEAHRAFVRARSAAGFVPQAAAARPLPEGAAAEPVDPELLRAAAAEVA